MHPQRAETLKYRFNSNTVIRHVNDKLVIRAREHIQTDKPLLVGARMCSKRVAEQFVKDEGWRGLQDLRTKFDEI